MIDTEMAMITPIGHFCDRVEYFCDGVLYTCSKKVEYFAPLCKLYISQLWKCMHIMHLCTHPWKHSCTYV